MSRDHVLVIDDEKINLFIIEEFLADANLDLDLHTDSMQAWNRLEAADSHFSLVLLDRMMPGLDGLSFLRRMKENPRFADIPVIMQTAAASPEQVREGLLAGAYYYLIKPYEPEALTSIVRGALEDYHSRRLLRQLSKRMEDAQKLLVSAEYRFVNLRDINSLVPVLAGYTYHPNVTASGLSDLMVNAVEHGNLEISYREKARLKLDGDWEREIERRLALPPYQGRYATIRADRYDDRVEFTITDQGNGFEWQRFLEFDPERVFDPNGRGIAMARKLSFSRVDYQGKGNIVVATVPNE